MPDIIVPPREKTRLMSSISLTEPFGWAWESGVKKRTIRLTHTNFSEYPFIIIVPFLSLITCSNCPLAQNADERRKPDLFSLFVHYWSSFLFNKNTVQSNYLVKPKNDVFLLIVSSPPFLLVNESVSCLNLSVEDPVKTDFTGFQAENSNSLTGNFRFSMLKIIIDGPFLLLPIARDYAINSTQLHL